MAYYLGKKLGSVEEAKEFNKKLYTFRASVPWCGCISTLACEHCGYIVHDSMCICAGIYDCPNCHKRTGVITWLTLEETTNKFMSETYTVKDTKPTIERPSPPKAQKAHGTEVSALDLILENRVLKSEIFNLKQIILKLENEQEEHLRLG